MDPLTHLTLGVSAGVSFKGRGKTTRRTLLELILFSGLIAMSPDLDSLIQSEQDPLLYIEFHRHFTHSFFWIPIGSALGAALLYFPYRWFGRPSEALSFFKVWQYGCLGLMTHGLLDAATSYGTHLLWPFSEVRTAWNFISIIDPLFTLPLLIGILFSLLKKSPRPSQFALVYCLIYLGLGAFQHHKAERIYREWLMTQDQNMVIDRLVAKPSFANLWLWRGIAVSENEMRVDGIFIPPIGEIVIYSGESVPRLSEEKVEQAFSQESRAYRDWQRFRFFSNDYLYETKASTAEKWVIGDLRYSLIPNSSEPLWVIELEPDKPEQKTPYLTVRDVNPEKRQLFFQMLRGRPLE